MPHRSIHASRRGAALIWAVAFMLLVAAAGIGFLAIVFQHQLEAVRKSQRTRLGLAAEAAVEAKRGRLKLIAGVQQDWSFLPSDGSWVDIDAPLVINGTTVQVQGRRSSATFESVPRARLRGVAGIGAAQQFAVEYDVRMAAFSDWSVYCGEPGAASWGAMEHVGNFYSRGSCNFNGNPTIFHRICRTNGTFSPVPNYSTGNVRYMNSQYPPEQNYPHFDIPVDAANYSVLQNRARNHPSGDFVYYENTLAIELNGTQFRRIYVRRNSTNGPLALGATNDTHIPGYISTSVVDNTGALPAGPDDLPTRYPGAASNDKIASNNAQRWVTDGGLHTGDSFQRGQMNIFTGSTFLNNTYYSVVTSGWTDIPDEGVIYLKFGSAQVWEPGASKDSLHASDRNRFVQRGINHVELVRTRYAGGAPARRSITSTLTQANMRTPICLLKGTITNKRLTVVGDGVSIVINDNIKYGTLASNPSLRLEANKEAPARLAMTEMLGVISRARWENQAAQSGVYYGGGYINQAYRYWNLLSVSERVPSPHTGYRDNQNCLDGVYLGSEACGGNYYHSPAPSQAVWYNGGLVALYCTYFLENDWNFVHYDWDYRLADTTPPYFLHSYNTAPVYIAGTWRGYDP